ncbi:MAG: hypothetical protein K0Q84_2310 [Arthrobacter sp.]|nr:hypothetical protein [Arthrobacter sp.]
MSSLLRYCRAVSLRALLVSSLLALAWLVWGADSAHASTTPSNAAVPETAVDLSFSDAPSLQAVQVLPAGQDPAGSVEPVVATATKAAAPVVATVDQTVAAVDRAVASATKRLPLPAVKLPQLSNLGHVATVTKTLPTVESRVPASSSPTTGRPVSKSPSVAVPPSRAAAVTPSAEASGFAPTSALSGTASPAPVAKNLATIQNIDSPVKTLAHLRMTASPRPFASAVQAPARGLWNEQPAAERFNIAATHGESGSFGSDSSGSHTAADIAASWNGLSPAAGILAVGASVTPPSGPAADPGSSPD